MMVCINSGKGRRTFHLEVFLLPIKAALADRKKFVKTGSIFVGRGRVMGRGSAESRLRGMSRGSVGAWLRGMGSTLSRSPPSVSVETH